MVPQLGHSAALRKLLYLAGGLIIFARRCQTRVAGDAEAEQIGLAGGAIANLNIVRTLHQEKGTGHYGN